MLPFLNKIFGISASSDNISSQEVEHINQEIYKKSVELSDRNKTLLILRKIDEIILSSVTDQVEIARKVTQILVTETDFEFTAIFKYDESSKTLNRLAVYETNEMYEANTKNAIDKYFISQISINEDENIIAQCVRDKRPISSNTLQNTLLDKDEYSKSEQMQSQTGVKAVLCYPIIVRDISIGAIVFALKEEEQNISGYLNDLLERAVQVIGIAFDNAQLYNELRDANEKLKSLDKLKDEFVSLASHELRTPMTAVKSYLWMTLKGEAGELNEKQQLYINRAYTSVERLIKLVNDMLNISRIESGRITIELDKVNILELAQEVIEEVLPRAKELGVNIYIDHTENIHEVLADRDKIKEVLFNLIGNSLKFTEKDGEINISFTEKDGFVTTKVSDTGAGISANNISKLFQKFNMLPESYSKNKNASGSGLGLYISRSIIEIHNGRMWATSEGLNKGSQFYFTLKVFNPNDEQLISKGISENSKIGMVHTAFN